LNEFTHDFKGAAMANLSKGCKLWFVHDLKCDGQSKNPVEVEIVEDPRHGLACIETVGEAPDWLDARYGSAFGGYYVPTSQLYATKREAEAAITGGQGTSDLEKFKAESKAKREAALDQLAEQAQELDVRH
jgi:hypothetical protein